MDLPRAARVYIVAVCTLGAAVLAYAASRVALDAMTLAQAALFIGLAVVVWRRVGPAFGIFVAVSLALPLSAPPPEYPLLSLPRFGLGIFPIFLALAVLGERPRAHRTIVWVSALLLGLTIARWSAGLFVA